MAITNAQQYQQLVNKSANGKRPGYRGSSYGSPSRSSSQGPAGGASSGGNYGGNRNPDQTYGGSIFSGGDGNKLVETTDYPGKVNEKLKEKFSTPPVDKTNEFFSNLMKYQTLKKKRQS